MNQDETSEKLQPLHLPKLNLLPRNKRVLTQSNLKKKSFSRASRGFEGDTFDFGDGDFVPPPKIRRSIPIFPALCDNISEDDLCLALSSELVLSPRKKNTGNDKCIDVPIPSAHAMHTVTPIGHIRENYPLPCFDTSISPDRLRTILKPSARRPTGNNFVNFCTGSAKMYF